MFSKLNIKVLLIILVILGAIFVISEYSGDKERSFSRVLLAVDTANVSEIQIHFPADGKDIILKKNSPSDWSVHSDENTFPADISVVKSILGQFTEIKPERIAATSRERWSEYEVTDSAAIRVQLKDKSKTMADVYFGKFSYTQPPQGQQMQLQMQQQQGKMSTYVRKADEDKVYAVEGFLKMSYQKDVNSYRNKTLVNVKRDDISRLEFTYPDYSFVVEKVNNSWMMNNQPADSLKTVRYLNKIQKLSSTGFLPPATPKTGEAAYKIKIEGNNFNPVELSAIPTSDTLVKWVITSSVNPMAEFDGTKSKLFERAFVNETEFLPDKKE